MKSKIASRTAPLEVGSSDHSLEMEEFIVDTTRPDQVVSSERLVYSVSEAAELLGISRAFAYELVARGELPVIRLGRRRLVPKVALLTLARTGQHSPARGAED